MLRIFYDDFDQKVQNIHDEMDLHHSYKRKACKSNNSSSLNGIVRDTWSQQIRLAFQT